MNKLKFFLSLLFMGSIVLMLPRAAMAELTFSCTSNGVSIGEGGTFTIPVDVSISKSTSSIVLTDMSTYTTCQGRLSPEYQDALQVTGATIDSQLTSNGFSGFAEIYGTKYNYPLPTTCIWPDAGCSYGSGVLISPVRVKIGIQRLTSGKWQAMTIPAGTEIARLSVIQRGAYGSGSSVYVGWGNNKTWIFTSKNPLVIPAYSCALNTPNVNVTLPPVKGNDLRTNGAGIYPVATPFKIDLACEPETTVTVKFDGATMTGKSDVLANTTSGNDAVGLQVLFNNNPITLGQPLQVVGNAQTQESLTFNAHYYYNGGALRPGPVTAVSTFTLTYN